MSEVFNCEFVIRDHSDYAGGSNACISGKVSGSVTAILNKIYEVDEGLGEYLAGSFITTLEDSGIEDVELDDDFSKNLKTLDEYADYIDKEAFIDVLREFMENQDTSDSGPVICIAKIDGEVIDIDYDIEPLKINLPEGWDIYK